MNNTSSWNSMYLNNNTIMDVISSKLGVKTNEILDVESGNMAVRVALAETEVIEDTKQWLEKQGVNISILDVFFVSLFSLRFHLHFSFIPYHRVGGSAWKEGQTQR